MLDEPDDDELDEDDEDDEELDDEDGEIDWLDEPGQGSPLLTVGHD